jgi:hypothetical protein
MCVCVSLLHLLSEHLFVRTIDIKQDTSGATHTHVRQDVSVSHRVVCVVCHWGSVLKQIQHFHQPRNATYIQPKHTHTCARISVCPIEGYV